MFIGDNYSCWFMLTCSALIVCSPFQLVQLVVRAPFSRRSCSQQHRPSSQRCSESDLEPLLPHQAEAISTGPSSQSWWYRGAACGYLHEEKMIHTSSGEDDGAFSCVFPQEKTRVWIRQRGPDTEGHLLQLHTCQMHYERFRSQMCRCAAIFNAQHRNLETENHALSRKVLGTNSCICLCFRPLLAKETNLNHPLRWCKQYLKSLCSTLELSFFLLGWSNHTYIDVYFY